MADLIAQLREYATRNDCYPAAGVMKQAANEIERQRAALSKLETYWQDQVLDGQHSEALDVIAEVLREGGIFSSVQGDGE